MAQSHDKPALITDAQRSPAQQMRTRQIRYGIMMLIRVILLIVAAILAMVEAPLMWLWLIVCAAGMVLLPWMAVLVANDRLPKEERRWFRRRVPEESTAEAIEPPKPPQVIDVDT